MNRQETELTQEQRDQAIAILEADDRKKYALLDRALEAWRIWSSTSGVIRRMFSLGVEPASNVVGISEGWDDKANPRCFDDAYLNWFDDQILSLDTYEKDLIRYEIFNKGNRRRAELWAQSWGYSPRTYYYHLAKVREKLWLMVKL